MTKVLDRTHLELLTGDGETSRATRLIEIPRQQVNLGTVAVLQMMARSGHLPRHRNYLLTSYDQDGNYLPPPLNQPDARWEEALAAAEVLRAVLFPKPDQADIPSVEPLFTIPS